MYDDASQTWFKDRAVGQSVSNGYSLKGRYEMSTPNSFQNDNRMVGQTFVRAGNDAPATLAQDFPASRDAGFYNNGYGSWAPAVEPLNNPVNPTLVYGTPVAYGVGTGLITVIVVGVLIYLVVKFWGD